MQEVVVASWPRHARRDLSPDSINLYSRERTMKSRSPLKAVLLIFAVLAGVGFAADTASAQATGTIRGRVLDAATLRPISGAQVVVRGTLLGAVTNNDGHYVISGVALGEQTVGVQMLGYQTADRTVTVTADGDVTVNFELSHQVFMLDEVVVTGTAGATQRRALGNTVSKVEAATITRAGPLGGFHATQQFIPPGGDPESAPTVAYVHVGTDYFRTFGIALRAGREFGEQDRPGAPSVAVVSESMARLAFPDGPAVGQTLVFAGNAYTVVGVAAEVRQRPSIVETWPMVYFPAEQQGGITYGVIAVRSR